jgi:hypothetical protein
MRQALKLHPDSHCAAVAGIEAQIALARPDALRLRYIVTGKIADIRFAPLAAPTRADELWKHTCFEAFLRPALHPWYCEFNFSPSRQWAAYRFSAYREGMERIRQTPPAIEISSTEDRFELQASLETAMAPLEAAWRLGLSAVIEETSGDISYWALAHPPGRADFHHADAFALAFPAPEQT